MHTSGEPVTLPDSRRSLFPKLHLLLISYILTAMSETKRTVDETTLENLLYLQDRKEAYKNMQAICDKRIQELS